MSEFVDPSELRKLREAIEHLTARVEALESHQLEAPPEKKPSPPAPEYFLKVPSPTEIKSPTPVVEEPAQTPEVGSEVSDSHQIESVVPLAVQSPEDLLSSKHSSAERLFKEKYTDDFFGGQSWESVVGERWLTWLGSGSLVLAVAYFVPWAWRHFELPAWFRVLVFHVAGGGILFAARLLYRKQLPQLAQGVAGLGIFTLYAAAYAMHHHYHLGGELSSTMTYVDCALITIGAIVIALRMDSVVVILLGGLGGFLTPLIASSGSGEYVVSFVYLAFLNVTLLACATLRPWQFLKPLALVATIASFLVWFVSRHSDASTLWGTEWLLALHALIFLVALTYPTVWWKRSSIMEDLMTLAGNSLWFVGATWILFHNREEQQLAAVCWGMSALHLGLFFWTLRCVTNKDLMPRWQLALSMVFFTLAVPLQLEDSLNYLAYAWAAEGLCFTAIAVYFADQQMSRAGLIVLGLALGRALGFDYTASPELLGETSLDRRFLVLMGTGLVTMAAGSCYWCVRRWAPARDAEPLDQQIGGLLLAIGNTVGLISLTCQWDSRLVLVLWTINAAFLWIAAFYSGISTARAYAAMIGFLFVGGRLLYHGDDVSSPFQTLLNDRFGSMVLASLIYFVPAWYLRTRVYPREQIQSDFESGLPAMLHVSANAVLLFAISLEIHDWFPGGRISTAEQVTYSVVWTIYAGVLVAAGFALKYQLPRMMGLIGFLLVGFKVFFVDLANLPLILRVLALAALGGMLLVTSFWYQKFSARLEGEGQS